MVCSPFVSKQAKPGGKNGTPSQQTLQSVIGLHVAQSNSNYGKEYKGKTYPALSFSNNGFYSVAPQDERLYDALR
jgi:hypothetical protein